jgi:antitoxin (DNA-binding transcriptional repressor) of toxin-antitoxin stability system
MSRTISASDLARRLADVLGRVRYGGETFLVERHSVPIARIGPATGAVRLSLADVARIWMSAADPDESFADDLERVGAADQAPRNPWAS